VLELPHCGVCWDHVGVPKSPLSVGIGVPELQLYWVWWDKGRGAQTSITPVLVGIRSGCAFYRYAGVRKTEVGGAWLQGV